MRWAANSHTAAHHRAALHRGWHSDGHPHVKFPSPRLITEPPFIEADSTSEVSGDSPAPRLITEPPFIEA